MKCIKRHKWLLCDNELFQEISIQLAMPSCRNATERRLNCRPKWRKKLIKSNVLLNFKDSYVNRDERRVRRELDCNDWTMSEAD